MFSHSIALAFSVIHLKFKEKSEMQLSVTAIAKSQGGKPALALRSLGDRFFIAAREGDHFHIREHAVFDVD